MSAFTYDKIRVGDLVRVSRSLREDTRSRIIVKKWRHYYCHNYHHKTTDEISGFDCYCVLGYDFDDNPNNNFSTQYLSESEAYLVVDIYDSKQTQRPLGLPSDAPIELDTSKYGRRYLALLTPYGLGYVAKFYMEKVEDTLKLT